MFMYFLLFFFEMEHKGTNLPGFPPKPKLICLGKLLIFKIRKAINLNIQFKNKLIRNRGNNKSILI
jgi:hypothetical protein